MHLGPQNYFGRRVTNIVRSSQFFTSLVVFLIAGTAQLFAQGNGIGTYDLRSPADLAVAFDYNGTGNADTILLYRPGAGVVYIVANVSGQWVPVFSSANGIGGYDLKSPADRIIPFDYDGSGLADHLVCYRPGAGIVFILKNIGGVFTPVYNSGHVSGIGGYDLASSSDRLVAFDYNGSGLNDHLLAYRPGTGTVSVLSNTTGSFAPVFMSSTGIGGWPLSGTSDILVPFDYYGVGSADHLIAYTPGTGKVSILENLGGVFSASMTSTNGIGGYDLLSTSDRLVAYDYNGSGSRDHIITFRPGVGIFWILQSTYLSFGLVDNDGTGGVGGFDLKSTADRIVPMDYAGMPGALFIYRPGQGLAFIETHIGNTFTTVYSSSYVANYIPGSNKPSTTGQF